MGRMIGLALVMVIAIYFGAVARRVAPTSGAPADRYPSFIGEGQPIAVGADPGASYRLIEWRRIGNGNLMTLTQRDDGRHTRLIRAEINCRSRHLREIATGRTPADDSRGAIESLHTSGPIARDLIDFICTNTA